MKLMKAENVSFCNEIVTAEDWCRGETGELTMFGKHNKLISEIKQGFNLLSSSLWNVNRPWS